MFVYTVVPRDASLIRSVRFVVCGIAVISKEFCSFKSIEILLIRSSPQNTSPVVFIGVFKKQKRKKHLYMTDVFKNIIKDNTKK